MDGLDALRVAELDRCRSLSRDLQTDIDMGAPAPWSECIFTTRVDDMLGASYMFPSNQHSKGGLHHQALPVTSPSNSSTPYSRVSASAPPSRYVSCNLLSSETENHQIVAIEDPISATPLAYTEEVKPENFDQVIEYLDRAFITAELSAQNNSCLLNTFKQDYDCGALPICHLTQEGYNVNDLLQLQMEELCPVEFAALPRGLSSSASCEDSFPTMDFWPLASLPFSSLDFSSPNIEDSPESLSEHFAEWLKTNGDRLSIADVKGIKLKTSTIENATKSLGGGRKGMSDLLKLILTWIENHHLPQKRLKSEVNQDCIDTDSRVVNNGVYNVSSTGDGISKDDVNYLGSFGNAIREERGLEMFFSGRQNQGDVAPVATVMALQGTKEQNLSPTTGGSIFSATLGSSYDSPLVLHAKIGEASGQMDTDFSTDPSSSNMRQLHGTSNPVYVSSHYNDLSPTPNIGLLSESLSNDRLWYASTAEVSPVRATLQDRNFHSFTAATAPHMSLDDLPNVASRIPAATTRAARRSRMARQRWSMRHSRIWPSAGSNQLSWASQTTGATLQSMSSTSQRWSGLLTSVGDAKQGKKPGRNLRFLLQKELKRSDVGNLGRIVLPKKEAELNLPYLAVRDGINLVIEDWSSSRTWTMRYRFWPNNKSRMYLLENTGDFVKLHGMKNGDRMMLYGDMTTGKYLIRGIKISRVDTSSAATDKSSSSSCRSTSTATGRARRVTPLEEGIYIDSSRGDLDTDGSRNGSPSDASSICGVLGLADGALLDELMDELQEDSRES